MAKRPPSVKRAQKAYEAEKLGAGEHIQINIKFKSAADVRMFEALRSRFPDLKDAGIARLAIKKLAGQTRR